jgi:hypothetical protein
MSAALERVISEQQATIDQLLDDIKRSIDSSATVYTRHNQLFEDIARLIDYELPSDPNEEQWTRFCKLRHAVRMQMLDTGYCLQCYNFVCECDNDG